MISTSRIPCLLRPDAGHRSLPARAPFAWAPLITGDDGLAGPGGTGPGGRVPERLRGDSGRGGPENTPAAEYAGDRTGPVQLFRQRTIFLPGDSNQSAWYRRIGIASFRSSAFSLTSHRQGPYGPFPILLVQVRRTVFFSCFESDDSQHSDEPLF